jgi:hypothetical protein
VSCLLIKCCKYFVFCSSTSAVFTAVLIMSSMIPLTILSLDFILFERESVYIRGVSNVCLSKHRCQQRSDWMFRINHPIAVNITNKCGLLVDFSSFHSRVDNVINDSFNYTVTRHMKLSGTFKKVYNFP